MKHFKKINQLLRSLAMLLCIVLLLPLLPVLPGSAEDPSLAAEGSAEGEVTVVCEDESKRTAFEKHYLLSDGTYYAVSYAEAVHEQDEQGKWVDAHSAPVYDEDEDAYLVKGKGYRASFGLSQNKAALVNKKGQALCWHYELIGYEDEKAVMKLEKKNAKAQGGKNASPKGKKVGDKDAFALPEAQGELLFEDAFSALGAEVRYTVSPQKIKEDVILNEKGRVYALSMVIENCDYKARLVENAVILEDSKGNDYFYVDAPLMYDAAGESSTAVQVLLKQTGKTVTVTYTPDKAWLDAPERVYPVTFDPAVTTEDYAANMEDFCTATAGSGPVECTTGNYAGVSGSTTYATYLRINNLPDTQGLPLLKANLHVTFSSVSLGLEGAELVLGTIDHEGELSGLLNIYAPTSTEVDSDVMMGASYSNFNLVNSALLEAMANEEGICYQLAFSGTVYDRLQIYGIEHASAPIATFCYGYQNPSFVGEQIFLNNNYTSIEDRKILKLHDTTLSMVNYNQWEARASMTLEEGANGGVYIYANYETRYLTAALSENNSYPAANDAVIGSDMVTSSNSSSVEKAEFVFTPLANGKYMIQLLSNPRLVLTRTANGLKLYNISSINTEQSWIITNIGDEIKTDGTVLKSGIYYINNLSSRTFMVLNAPTATTPILKAGTEAALGDKMAWNIRNFGNGYFVIESVYAPGYYLTCSSSEGVAVEFLSGYETVPNKAKFTAVRTSDGYAFKSGTNHYLSKSSSSSTALSTATSASSERARWRVCLKTQYHEFSSTLTDSIVWIKPQGSASIPYEAPLSTRTWCTASDFTVTNGNTAIASASYNTVTGTAQGGISNVTIKHLPSGKSLTATVKCGLLEDGTYYIKNKETKTYLQPDNDALTTLGAKIEHHSLNKEQQAWELTLLSDGSYKIASSVSYDVLTVQSGEETSQTKAIIQSNYAVSPRQQWRISQTSTGAFNIMAKSSPESQMLVLTAIDSTSAPRICQTEYTDDTDYLDEWTFYSTIFYVVNYYESSLLSPITHSILSTDEADITNAVEFLNAVYNDFGISFELDGSPIYYENAISDDCPNSSGCTDESCGSDCRGQHHNNIRRISDQLYEDDRENSHVYVMWTKKSRNTFCKTENGVHKPNSYLGVVYGDRPVVFMMSGSKNQKSKALILAHEIAHTLGLPDVYDNPGHDVENDYVCVMEKYYSAEANEFYTEILDGSALPFCPSCTSSLSTLLPTKLYHGNIYGE